jgi:hypothetical protein
MVAILHPLQGPVSLESSLVLSVSPVTPYGFVFGAGTAVTDFCTCGVTGGTAPYSFAWQGDGGITNPNGATTSFTKFMGQSPDFIEVVFTCRVTDAIGRVGSISVNVAFIAEWQGGGFFQ